ncbi:O-methyltransferase [Burkholderia gladioli]|uniref:O-methyltransferase n=1 Tax=Burkholderia gladioli TaxID=28095 RepID=UPI0031329E16
MSASFRRIDYSLRPAKHAERRMLCDIFRRLRPFGRVEDYVYVGFGSVWFSDFSLFHRALGIKSMISIEQTTAAKERIEANKPFQIPVVYDRSTNVLPRLDWAQNQFLWLDYDDPLSLDMMHDMRTVATRAGSGTVLAISVQCSRAPQLAEFDEQGPPSAIERFAQTFGRERTPPDVKEMQLYGWKYGALSRSMLFREVESALSVRNAQAGALKMNFRPICEIEYEDGAKMTTVVGIFHNDHDAELITQCHFDTLDFLVGKAQPIRISVPKLTPKEFRKLEAQLPLAAGTELDTGSMPPSDAKQFAELYRYLPNFAVLET